MKYKTFSHLFLFLIKKNIRDVKDVGNDNEMGDERMKGSEWERM